MDKRRIRLVEQAEILQNAKSWSFHAKCPESGRGYTSGGLQRVQSGKEFLTLDADSPDDIFLEGNERGGSKQEGRARSESLQR